jgi:acetyl-CoA C-acetyltransferase
MTQVAITGIGEAPVGRFADRSALTVALRVAAEAIDDAGIERRDIDALLAAPCFADPWFNTDLGFARLVDELGLRGTVRLNAQVNAGGSTGTALLQTAAGLIASKRAETVLCVHTEKFTNLSGQEGFDFFAKAGIERDFEAPNGMVYNALPALATQRYLYEHDAPIEYLAEVAVSCRRWAELHPCAMFREPITVDDVMSSPMIATPLRSLMLNALGDGGSAFIVTTGERARATTNTPVYMWGEGGIVNTYSFAQHEDLTRMNWSVAGHRAFEEARISPSNVDIVEIYMAYPIFHLILLEELGFAERGRAGELVASGATSPGGSLPMSTNGDAMSYGHIGAGVGVATVVETCRQLMGKAGERQVPNASIALKTSAGGAYADAQVTIFGKEPR